jgi:hypothetical protein
MKSIFAAGIALCLLSVCAQAFSDTEVSTKSFLFSYNTDFSALRTIMSNHVTTPELDLQSDGRITTTVELEDGGSANIEQSSIFTGGRDASGKYNGQGRFSSSASGIGMSKINQNIFFSGLCFFTNVEDDMESRTKVESKSMGVALASPGTNDYLFGLETQSQTMTNARLLRVPKWMTEDPKIFTVSLESEPLDVEEPMDSISQDINLDFHLFENELYGYNYDFSKVIENDETTFNSQMKFAKIM